MKVIAWNMYNRRAHQNWDKVAPGGDLECDIALLSEATPPPTDLVVNVCTAGQTIGRDDLSLGGKKTRRWATAIASPHVLSEPEDVWALPPREDPLSDRRSRLTVSRPGSWIAAVVSLPGGEAVTAISLYGLLDERSDASVHRSLSDLTPLFEDTRYNNHLVIGGDLNTLCTAEPGSKRLARDQGVVDRIVHGFGLIDLLQASMQRQDPARGRLDGCGCRLGDACRHTWTYRTARNPDARYQDDYLFASPALAERLTTCSAPAFTPDWPSDHVPVIAEFE